MGACASKPASSGAGKADKKQQQQRQSAQAILSQIDDVNPESSEGLVRFCTMRACQLSGGRICSTLCSFCHKAPRWGLLGRLSRPLFIRLSDMRRGSRFSLVCASRQHSCTASDVAEIQNKLYR